MHTLYQLQSSGNCYKLRLLMAQLGVPFRIEEVDMLGGGTRTPGFLAINSNGKIPVLQLDDGRILPESNAAMWYLAGGRKLLPDDRFAEAQALRWMFFEQYSHEPYIAVAHYWLHILGKREDVASRLPDLQQRGHQALGVMDQHLAANDFFAGGTYSIADIALFAYTHLADEAEFDLAPYDHINAWLGQVSAQPGHIDMAWRP